MGSSLLVVEYDDRRVRELDPEEILKVA
jgi:hypothetical protein